MLNRRFDVVPALIALALLSCASPKSANPAQGPAGVSTPGLAVQGRQAEAPLTFAIDLRDGSRIVGMSSGRSVTGAFERRRGTRGR